MYLKIKDLIKNAGFLSVTATWLAIIAAWITVVIVFFMLKIDANSTRPYIALNLITAVEDKSPVGVELVFEYRNIGGRPANALSSIVYFIGKPIAKHNSPPNFQIFCTSSIGEITSYFSQKFSLKQPLTSEERPYYILQIFKYVDPTTNKDYEQRIWVKWYGGKKLASPEVEEGDGLVRLIKFLPKTCK
jgi:hypothetical protein